MGCGDGVVKCIRVAAVVYCKQEVRQAQAMATIYAVIDFRMVSRRFRSLI